MTMFRLRAAEAAKSRKAERAPLPDEGDHDPLHEAAEALRKCLAEVVGTFLLVFFGTATVASAVCTGAQQGVWQVAACWGFGVALSIYATAGISGAHLNPAVTLSLLVVRRHGFPARHAAPYALAQLAGSIMAGLMVLACFGGALDPVKFQVSFSNFKFWSPPVEDPEPTPLP